MCSKGSKCVDVGTEFAAGGPTCSCMLVIRGGISPLKPRRSLSEVGKAVPASVKTYLL